MAFSSVRRKSDCLSVISLRPFSFSMFLTHLFACPCGSIISGQRVPRVTSTPFSVEKASAGSPWMFQSRTSSLFARKAQKSKPAEHGMFSVRTPLSHWSCSSFARYSESNGPQYERKAAASRQSPIRLTICSSSPAIEPSQRARSPPRPSTRLEARVSFSSSSSESRLSVSFLLTPSLY